MQPVPNIVAKLDAALNLHVYEEKKKNEKGNKGRGEKRKRLRRRLQLEFRSDCEMRNGSKQIGYRGSRL